MALATGACLPALASLRSDFVLQLLSAMVMFTLLFVIFAALAALFVLLLVAADHMLEWAAAEIASTVGVSPVVGLRCWRISVTTSIISDGVGGRRRKIKRLI